MAELGQPLEQDIKPVSPETGKAVGRDAVKNEQAVERMPKREDRLRRMMDGVGNFVSDLGKANELAKNTFEKSTAIQHILKGAGVATAGVTGEVLSKLIWKSVEAKIGEKTGNVAEELLEKLTGNRTLREMVENIGIMVGYNWVSSQIGDALPKIPVHYLGLSLGIDVLDKGVLNKGDKDTWLDYSNAVTDTGVAMIVGGVVTLGREFAALRRVRAKEGKGGVEKLLFAKAQAANIDQRKARAERLVRLIEGGEDGKKNGAPPKGDNAKT